MNKKEAGGRKIASERPAYEIDICYRPDRAGKYLKKYLDKLVFDEFSADYLESQKLTEALSGVPIPLRKEDMEKFNTPKGLPIKIIAENMALVLGIDPKFKYKDVYIDFMRRSYGRSLEKGITNKGKDEGEKENYDLACIYFRAALCCSPQDLPAMYGYARACRAMYLDGGSSTYVGELKAESIEYFELLTELHPKFAEAHYYLGYAYLNMGLYQKAALVWQDFVKKSNNAKDKKEIKERIKQLSVPLEIERGYNFVLSQRWAEGIDILEPHLKGKYKEWWPLHYYLGVAYINTGRRNDAVRCFETVLKLSPQHIETMEELVSIYQAEKNLEKVEKYRGKIELLKKGGHAKTKKVDGHVKPEKVEDDIKKVKKEKSNKLPKRLK